MDTASDTRILMAERCVKDMRNMLSSMKGVPKDAPKIVGSMEAKLMEIKYSYAEVDEMKGMLEELNSLLMHLYQILGGEEWARKLRSVGVDEERIARIKFCMNIIYNLGPRLKLPGDAAYAVDVRIGEVESVIKHPNADKLKVCNVNVGKMITVVTNDMSVKAGDRIAVALLPPAELRGVVSEGMFVGAGEGVSRKEGEIGSIPELSEEEKNSIRKEVFRYIRS